MQIAVWLLALLVLLVSEHAFSNCQVGLDKVTYSDGLLTALYRISNTGDKVLFIQNRDVERDAILSKRPEHESINLFHLQFESDTLAKRIFLSREGRAELYYNGDAKEKDAKTLLGEAFLPGVVAPSRLEKELKVSILACLLRSETEEYQSEQKEEKCRILGGKLKSTKFDGPKDFDIVYDHLGEDTKVNLRTGSYTACFSPDGKLLDLRPAKKETKLPRPLSPEESVNAFIGYMKKSPDGWFYTVDKEKLVVRRPGNGFGYYYGSDIKKVESALKEVGAKSVETEEDLSAIK